MMQFEVYQLLNDPVLITFLILTVLSMVWKFLRMWIVSLISCALIGTIIIILLITIGQVAGAEDLIRQLITSHYTLGGMLTLSFRDILLLLLLIISFQLGLAAHTVDFEKRFHERLMCIPKRPNHHYEMESTFECSFRRKQ